MAQYGLDHCKNCNGRGAIFHSTPDGLRWQEDCIECNSTGYHIVPLSYGATLRTMTNEEIGEWLDYITDKVGWKEWLNRTGDALDEFIKKE